MQEMWIEKRKGGDFQAIAQKFGISPIIARVMRNREVTGSEAIQEYLHGELECLHDGLLLKDMRKAVDIIIEKIQEQKRMRIIGDYDADGVNATYILLEGLGRLGAVVDSDIPDRIKDGYGLNKRLVEQAIADGIDTIVTCDNGIAAFEAIAYGKEKGLTIVVTDHHEIPRKKVDGKELCFVYPEADAIVDPQREDCAYPFPHLCGAAVAYKLVEVLFQIMGDDVEDVDYLMENVAIATVCDVMNLIGENRVFVKQGLAMLQRTQNLGLKALMSITLKPESAITSYHLGFVIGPCINASGRLDTAKKALALLCAKDSDEAMRLAQELKELNEKRKDMTADAVEEAKMIVEQRFMEDRVLVVHIRDCHESLGGLVAGRLRELHHKPVYVLTDGETIVKGSGRSIEAYHMIEEMSKCQELFFKERFGGHKAAAGFSVELENVDALRCRLNELCNLTKEDMQSKIYLDMVLPIQYVDEKLVRELAILEPFGTGNEKPCFGVSNLEVTRLFVMGKDKNFLKFGLRDADGCEIEGVYFGDGKRAQEYMEEKYGKRAVEQVKRGRSANIKMSFAYYPGMNEFNGNTNLQLIIQNYQ